MAEKLEQMTWGGYKLDDVGRYERSGVKVFTSWLPVQRVYETLVIPSEFALIRLGGEQEQYGTDRQAAEIGHYEWCLRVDRALDADQYRRVM
jgi:hypothetical protein